MISKVKISHSFENNNDLTCETEMGSNRLIL
jgi:hypothetical protein